MIRVRYHGAHLVTRMMNLVVVNGRGSTRAWKKHVEKAGEHSHGDQVSLPYHHPPLTDYVNGRLWTGPMWMKSGGSAIRCQICPFCALFFLFPNSYSARM